MSHEIEYFGCSCGEKSHVIRVDIEKNPDWSEFAISLKMNTHLNFFNRLKQCILYIFKIESKDYQYVDIILDNFELEKLKNAIEKYTEKKD